MYFRPVSGVSRKENDFSDLHHTLDSACESTRFWTAALCDVRKGGVPLKKLVPAPYNQVKGLTKYLIWQKAKARVVQEDKELKAQVAVFNIVQQTNCYLIG